ncbi:MAG: hypothetical protein QOI04_2334 [Verrucomicrobiota bacterium]
MAPIVRELRARERAARSTYPVWHSHFCFSRQHDSLARPFLDYFEIEPDSELDLMESGQSLGQLRSRAAAQLDIFFQEHAGASAALVQGDTTTAFAAALSAFDHKIPVGHVEAGLRTSDIREPFPEELNRRLISRIAKWHYAPTPRAREALLEEKVAPESILVTGNTGIDSFLETVSRPHKPSLPALAALQGKRVVLVTAHRRENIGAALERISTAVVQLASEFNDVLFVVPVHKNPDVAAILEKKLSHVANILLTAPLDYPDLVWVMKIAELIMTDSGGIQEEAPSLRKPVLLLRNETERPEAVEYGTSFLVGSDSARIVAMARDWLTGKRKIDIKGTANPYGDGHAAKKIGDHLLAQISH